MEAYGGNKSSPAPPASASSPAVAQLAAALDALSSWHSLNVAPSLLPSLEAAMAPVLAAQAALAAGGAQAGDALTAYGGLPQDQRVSTPAAAKPAPAAETTRAGAGRLRRCAALTPAAFTLLGEGIQLAEQANNGTRRVMKQARNGWRAAVCNADSPMVDGKHYVEFNVMVCGYGELNIGCVEAGYDPLKIPERLGEGEMVGPVSATETAGGWGLFVGDGRLKHNNKYSAWAKGDHAAAFPSGGSGGKIVGLLLDLDRGSLSCYVGGVEVGMLVGSGLMGPLCWMCELYDFGDEVAAEAKDAPA